MQILKKTLSSERNAAKAFYFVALIAFTFSLLLNQPQYFRNDWKEIIILDMVCLIAVYLSLFLFFKKSISLKLGSAVYVYAIFLDLALSSWLYYKYQNDFRENFLLNTFFYCINIVVAGFCNGRKHLYLASLLYILIFGHIKFLQ